MCLLRIFGTTAYVARPSTAGARPKGCGEEYLIFLLPQEGTQVVNRCPIGLGWVEKGG